MSLYDIDHRVDEKRPQLPRAPAQVEDFECEPDRVLRTSAHLIGRVWRMNRAWRHTGMR